jgi:hypothetical protein
VLQQAAEAKTDEQVARLFYTLGAAPIPIGTGIDQLAFPFKALRPAQLDIQVSFTCCFLAPQGI